MPSTANENMLTKIKQILLKPDTVILVGSGISMWSGIPSWSRLILDLAVFVDEEGGDGSSVRKEIENNDLLLAASYGVSQISQQQFGKFMRKACKFGEAKPHEIHRKIVSLKPKCFITPNYDQLLEDALNL